MGIHYEVQEKISRGSVYRAVEWESLYYDGKIERQYLILSDAKHEKAWAEKVWPYSEFRIVKITTEVI